MIKVYSPFLLKGNQCFKNYQIVNVFSGSDLGQSEFLFHVTHCNFPAWSSRKEKI